MLTYIYIYIYISASCYYIICYHIIPDHVGSKLLASDNTFPWWLLPCRNFKILIDSFEIFWWLKNSAFWLSKNILAFSLWKRIFPNTYFLHGATAPFILPSFFIFTQKRFFKKKTLPVKWNLTCDLKTILSFCKNYWADF